MRVAVLTLEADGLTTVEGAFASLDALMAAVADSWPDEAPHAADPREWEEEGPGLLAFRSGLAGPGIVWRAHRVTLEGAGDRAPRDTIPALREEPWEDPVASRGTAAHTAPTLAPWGDRRPR